MDQAKLDAVVGACEALASRMDSLSASRCDGGPGSGPQGGHQEARRNNAQSVANKARDKAEATAMQRGYGKDQAKLAGQDAFNSAFDKEMKRK